MPPRFRVVRAIAVVLVLLCLMVLIVAPDGWALAASCKDGYYVVTGSDGDGYGVRAQHRLHVVQPGGGVHQRVQLGGGWLARISLQFRQLRKAPMDL